MASSDSVADEVASLGRTRGNDWRSCRWWLIVPALVGTLLLLGVAAVWLRLERTDIPEVESTVPAEVVALVGSDRRGNTPSADLPIFGTSAEVPGERADAILLISTIPGQPSQRLGIPRDLLVPNSSGEPERLSMRFEQAGPAGLVRGLCDGIGIPVSEVVVVRFETVQQLVDAVGGVEVDSEVPLRDQMIGLEIQPGVNALDGSSAVSYARARTLEVRRGDAWVPDITRSAARSDRAAQVASAVADKLLKPRAVLDGVRAAWTVTPTITVSSGAGPVDLYSLASALRDRGPVADLPVVAKYGPVPALLIDQSSVDAIESFLGAPPDCRVKG